MVAGVVDIKDKLQSSQGLRVKALDATLMEKAIDTSTTRWRKINFPKASPPPQKDSKPFRTTRGNIKKDGSNTSSKTIRIHTPSLPNRTPPLYQPPPQKPLISSYEKPAAGKPSANT
jgi:hypothetical protein